MTHLPGDKMDARSGRPPRIDRPPLAPHRWSNARVRAIATSRRCSFMIAGQDWGSKAGIQSRTSMGEREQVVSPDRCFGPLIISTRPNRVKLEVRRFEATADHVLCGGRADFIRLGLTVCL